MELKAGAKLWCDPDGIAKTLLIATPFLTSDTQFLKVNVERESIGF